MGRLVACQLVMKEVDSMYVVVSPFDVGEGVFFVCRREGLRLLRMRNCVILRGLVLMVECA